MKTWSYADLSRIAKMNGGPEQYVEIIRNSGFQEGIKHGRKEGVLIMLGAAAGAIIVKTVIDKSHHKRVTHKEYEDAKKILIYELNEQIKNEEKEDEDNSGESSEIEDKTFINEDDNEEA